MAYIRAVTDNQTGTDSTSFTISLPEHQANDVLFIFVTKDDGAGGTISTPSGWTLVRESVVGTSGNNTCRGGCWYKVAASSSETEPTVTSSDSDSWCGCAVSVIGANTTTPVDVSGVNTDTAGEPYTCNAITTTTNNTLLLFSCSSDGAVQPVPKPGAFLLSAKDDGTACGLGVGWRYQATAGSTGVQDWVCNSTGDESVLIAVAVNDDGTNKKPLYPKNSGMTIIDPLKAAGIRTSNADTGNISDSYLLGTGRAVGYAYRDRGGTFTDYTTQINDATDADVLFFDAVGVQQVGDAFYIGDANKFYGMRFDRAGCTAGVAGVVVKEYWNGSAWTTLPNQYDQTSSLTSTVADNHTLAWRTDLPLWTTTTVNGQSAYWIRWRLTTVYTTNPTVSQCWVGDKGVHYDGLAAVGDTGVYTSEASIASSPNITGNAYSGATRTFGASDFDCSTGVVVGTYLFGNPRDQTDIGNTLYGGVPFCVGNASNQYKTWIIGGYNSPDTPADKRNVYAVQLGQSTATHKWVSSTPPSAANVRKMLIANDCINGSSLVYFSQLVHVTNLEINGGSSAKPGTWTDVIACANAYPCPLINNNTTCYVPLQLGGTDPTYIDASLFLLEYPQQASVSAKRTKFHVDDGYCGVTIKAIAGDVIKLRSATISGGSRIKFAMDAATSATATYDFSGLTIVNANVTLQNVMTYSSMSFVGCNKIALAGLTISGCTFTNPGDGTCCSISTTTTLTNVSFNTATAGNYAIEIANAGTYNFTNVIYTGFTTDINVTATTGTVTIQYTGDTPTYTTAGATVVLSGPELAVTAEDLIDGTRVQVYNITTDTEIDNSVVSGGLGYSYTITTQASTGDVIRLRATYVDGNTAKEPIEQTGIFSSGGLAFLAPQTDWAVYNTWAIDGSAVTDYEADGVNIDINIIGTGSGTKKELGAWWAYYCTTEDGIRDFFGAFVFEAANSMKQDISVVDIVLEKTSTGNFTFTDNDVRYYRSDFSIPYDTTGNSIFMDYSGVPFVAETGVSGLTAQESAALLEISSVKAKTDNLPAKPASQGDVIAFS